ncbi:ras-related c3 botulinum toxin substrate [Anaeramoeba ignava]|uniref:Ras-related c3 botulinum toxin substrate n=1 Tax=Anaeramoeba ignava TaxID=1746090 RepID=A0A9Q0LQ16_ANAIG|nr:ras-related c3 botulinum toxin substrate [Anaeramoeba ignava]
MEKLKIVFIGDGAIGKTTLLMIYDLKYLPEEYIPSVYDNFSKTYKIEKNKEIEIEFWDTERNGEFDRSFPLIYPQTDLIVICFAIDYYYSFEKIESFWIPEIEHYSPNTKRILIGTKIDLRNNRRKNKSIKRI